MKNIFKTDISFLLQRFALIIFIVFPITLSIIAQILLLVHSWSFVKFLQFGFLTVIFLVPIFAIMAKNSIWESIEQFGLLPVIWVVALAIILRIIFVQLIGTHFVSDMEDVYFLAVDIYSGNPLANIDKYPNIPGATHLNMLALVLSFFFKLFGTSTNVAKLLMIMFGGLTTFLIYLVGREIANMKTGFFAAFLFATLPSAICYTGVLTGDHLALPFMLLAILMYARMEKFEKGQILFGALNFVIVGILVGLAQWFRPLGIILISALIISVLIYRLQKGKFLRVLLVLCVLFLSYTATSNLAVKFSENIFKTKVLSSSQRIGEFLLKGLNPTSNGIVTVEDDTIARATYERFEDDSSGAQKYLINLALSRLDRRQLIHLFQNKFTLIWSSHNALFDYSLGGSQNQDLVNLFRDAEALLYLAITAFILVDALVSVRWRSHPAIFVMQLFILGFALLLLFMEVQNRYVMIVIPFSMLLGVMGMEETFSKKSKAMTSH